MKIVKAEILWTRKCPLNCAYCNMADGRRNSLILDQWKLGFDNLKQLGCGFAAFYGAEPLADFDKLPEVVGYAESIGIHTTVITSGAIKNLKKKIDILYNNGAKSLSMSYDIVGLDQSSKIKTNKAIEHLLYFKEKGNIRDVAAISTLTRSNYKQFLTSVKILSKLGIWSFFDLIHDDRKQPGSKCKHCPITNELIFKKEDNPSFVNFLYSLKKLKDQGFLCHPSHGFMDLLIQDPSKLQTYNWNCAQEKGFPAWVTVDCDGTVYPCDDFQPKISFPIPVYKLYDQWNLFCRTWKPIVKNICPGCLWNTHIDAHFIKQGKQPFSDYVHTKGLK